ncbi:MAG: PilT/PilU family type 4a pilus ATPase [Candidatus Omnitrophica bacterium]|nr:PilT/PilU family type 4a pilus ATPase [Candidatus Omnitrophota bacterium]
MTPNEKESALAAISGINTKSKGLPKEFVGHAGQGAASVLPPPALTTGNSLNEILVFARYNKVSDVHLCSKNPIIFRKFGSLKAMTENALTPERVQAMIKEGIKPELVAEFEQRGDLEFVHTIGGAGRFRLTLMKQRNGWDLTARLVAMSIPNFESTGMSKSCENLTKWAQGLVLVTGPIGCGKSTTLATLVEMINQTRNDHIITIENPIEIIYTPKKCQITQREVNLHTMSQANALRAALREDPDILVVSELRDLESIQLAVSAAETGHLVFGTMNTNNASQTISRIIDSFPSEEQGVIKNMVSESLRGVITQQLIPKKDGSGVVPAYEILIVNSAIANLIREGRTTQLTNTITTGRSAGMMLFDHSLEELAQKGVINGQEAYERAISPNNFAKYLNAPAVPPPTAPQPDF